MMPYCNNLKKGDEVEDTRSRRRGRVMMQPRDYSVKVCVLLDGVTTPRYFPVGELRLVLDGVAEAVAPVDGVIPGSESAPATPSPVRRTDEKPDQEKTEASILDKVTRFEATASPLKTPEHTRITGEHIKHYLVTYIDRKGSFNVEKVAAKGIVTAITIFYMSKAETAIVSVVCVL